MRALDVERLATFTEATARDKARARASLRQAFDAVCDATVAARRTGLERAGDAAAGDAWADVPAPAQVDWPRQMRPIVDAATGALLDALRHDWPVRLEGRPTAYFMTPPDPRGEGVVAEAAAADAPPASVQAGLDALVCQWARVAAAVLGADAAIGRLIDALRTARPPWLPTPRASSGLRAWVASVDASEAAAGVPVVPFLQHRAIMRAASGLLTLDPGSSPGVVAIPRTWRPFTLFALPAAWAPPGDRMPARDLPWSTLLEPDVLTDRGLAACRIATRLDDARALVTLLDGSGSYAVEEDGRLDRSQPWPQRVDGEIACGARGRLAWSREGASQVLFRPQPGAPAVAWAMPVAPLYALADGAGSAWLATADGLWRWREAAGPTPVSPGPALVALHRQGTGVRAYRQPTVRADGSRIAIESGLRVDRRGSGVDGASDRPGRGQLRPQHTGAMDRRHPD